MSLRSSYHHIREQLVNLTLELEDKSKACDVLDSKVTSLRNSISLVDTEFAREYKEKIEVEGLNAKEKIDELIKTSTKLISEKKEVLERSKDLVNKIKSEEKKIASAVRKENQMINDAIEQDKKTFKAGSEERLQKFLSVRMTEMKELTLKALQPEINRISLRLESELLEADQRARAQEKVLKEEMDSNLRTKCRRQEERIKEEFELQVRERHSAYQTEDSTIESEHTHALRTLQTELENDLEALKTMLNKRFQQSRREALELVSCGQEELAEKLRAARTAHANEMRALQKDHDDQIKAMRVTHEQTRVSIFSTQTKKASQTKTARTTRANEKQARKEKIRTSIHYLDTADTDSSSGEETTSTSRGRPAKDDEGDDINDVGRGGYGVSIEGLDGGEDIELDEDLEAVIKQLKNDIELERDKKIQSEIRSLQAETVRLERQWRAKAESELKRIFESREAEEKLCSRRQKQLTDEISELVIGREDLSTESKILADKIHRVEEVINENEWKVEKLDEETAMIQNKLKELNDKKQRNEQQKKESMEREKEKLKETYNALRQMMEEEAVNHQKYLLKLRRAHEEELALLDAQVKEQVEKKDEEIELVRDALQTEKIKLAKLDKLLKQYEIKAK